MQRRWLEPLFLSLFFAATLSLWVFLAVADEVVEGETHELDMAIVLALHPQDAGRDPLGPAWAWGLARDITALGSVSVLVLLVLSTIIYLLMARRARTALFVMASSILSYTASHLLKLYFDRPRPDLIPHDIHLTSTSFPSGHAMMSAAIYLTLGAVLAEIAPARRLKIFVLSIALLLTGLVGFSRVYLGVHWPSDVVAGWSAGAAWAIGAWALAHAWHLSRRTPADG